MTVMEDYPLDEHDIPQPSAAAPLQPPVEVEVPPTTARINAYLTQIDADPNSTYRPTEAQLRWAHCQREETARDTKARLEWLMHYPTSGSDVEGAHASDGQSSVNDDDGTNYDTEASSLDRHYSPSESQSPASRAYLGMRRDRQGQWVRRHFSQTRFPNLAAKAVHSSPSRKSKESGDEKDDGRCESSDQSTSNQFCKSTTRKKRVDKSRGRRAPLRVSARALEERKAITSSPLRLIPEDTVQHTSYSLTIPGPVPSESTTAQYNNTPINSPKTSRRKKKLKPKVVFENATDLDSFERNRTEKKISTLSLEDEISGLFTATSSRRSGSAGMGTSSFHRRRQNTGSSQTSYVSNEDEERIRRFEEAYKAIMLVSDGNHGDDEAIVSTEWLSRGGKRWTRDPNVSSAVSIDGRQYDDIQRAPTASLKQMATPDCYDGKNGKFRVELHDRAASWLVHVPRPSPKGLRRDSELNVIARKDILLPGVSTRGRGGEMDTTEARNVLLSPCQKKLSDIETTIQRSDSGTTFDLMQNRKAIAQGSPMRQYQMKRLDGTAFPPITTSVPKISPPPIPKRQLQMTETESAQLSTQASKLQSAGKLIPALAKPMLQCKDGSDMSDEKKQTGGDSTSSSVRSSTLRMLFSGVSNKPVQPTRIFPTKKWVSPKEEIAKSRPGKLNVTAAKAKFEGNAEQPKSFAERGGKSVPKLEDTRTNLAGTADDIDANKSYALWKQRVASPAKKDGVAGDCGLDDIDGESEELICTTTLDPPEKQLPQLMKRNGASKSSPNNPSLQNLNVASLVRESLVRTDRSIIDTDGAESVFAEFDEEQHLQKVGSMLMSPALITKRYQQALNAIETRNWDQISYLVNANPWLTEMKDVRNDQFLVHPLALFGGGQHETDEEADPNPAPKQLVCSMIEYDPSVVQKLDNEGNLPLHMAAASANILMIKELGMRFAAGASVQNHDGMLPLHLAILSCALFPTGDHAVELILALFPGGVSVKDSDGNTPLHIAAGTLKGDVGVDIIYQLTEVCNELSRANPAHLKDSISGHTKKPKQRSDDASIITSTTEPYSDVDDSLPGSVVCVVKNNNGETPLARAITSRSGWQVAEALLNINGGHLAVLEKNSTSQNALHLVLEREFNDAAIVLALLKSVPLTASIADGSGTTPIQLACMNSLQREVILALAIIDLPIDLGAKEEAIVRNGYGASWWFLLCESNDHYLDIVKEILSLCSHPQKMALCLARVGPDGENRTAVASATPRCKMELMKSLRFLGRFEFIGSDTTGNASSQTTQQFVVIDYGSHDNLTENGKKASLKCFNNAEEFSREAKHLHQVSLNPRLFEELNYFSVTEQEANAPQGIRIKYCVSVNTSKMSLARVVAGMPKDHKYRSDMNLLSRYFGKAKSILHLIAEALGELHNAGIAHGNIDSHHIGKFGEDWKVTGILGSAVNGERFASARLGLHSPPETFQSCSPLLSADPTVDVWSFGKLMYEVLVGESIFKPFSEEEDTHLLSKLVSGWNDNHLAIIATQLFDARIGAVGIDLISRCLRPVKKERPRSMQVVLQHPFWNDKNVFHLS